MSHAMYLVMQVYHKLPKSYSPSNDGRDRYDVIEIWFDFVLFIQEACRSLIASNGLIIQNRMMNSVVLHLSVG